MGTTKVLLWLQLDFSLSKAADSTATGAGVLVPSLPQDASADRAGPPSGAGNSKAEPIYDTDLEGTPTTKLLKGRESQFLIGYGVADTKDVVLQVQPGFEYESMLFN